jgi:hypothetical protein
MYQKLHADMGPVILRHLAQFGDHTQLLNKPGILDGYIAGQAVASAVSELFRSGLAVAYNDVDAFLFSNEIENNSRKVLATITSYDLMPDCHYGQVSLASNAVYGVNSTARDGMLNEVFCRYLSFAPRDEDEMAQAFLRSFDLNCVQVAVRLKDQKLVWTPAFEQFLETREMLVMNVKTPVHTAVRWFRKKAELEGVFGHDEKTMALLASSLVRVKNRLADCSPGSGILWERSLRAASTFGKVYGEKAAAVSGELGKYFDIVDVTDRKIALQTLESRGCEMPELVKAECSDLVLPNYSRALQGHWRKHVSDQMVEAFRAPWNSASRRLVSMEGPEAIAALRSPKDMAMLDKLTSEHGGLGYLMSDMNTARQLEFAHELKDMVRREGVWVYGLFEHLNDARVELATIDREQLRPYMEQRFATAVIEYDELSRQTQASMPRLVPTPIFDYKVSELVSFKDLLEEGSRMHHCVGGYFREVVSGHSRILRLQRHRVEDCITIQLSKDYGKGANAGWFLRQVHGLQNRQASAAEQLVADRLALLVNMQSALQRIRISPSLVVLESIAVKAPAISKMLAATMTYKTRSKFQSGSPMQRLWKKVKGWWAGAPGTRPATFKPATANGAFQDLDEDIPF